MNVEHVMCRMCNCVKEKRFIAGEIDLGEGKSAHICTACIKLIVAGLTFLRKDNARNKTESDPS